MAEDKDDNTEAAFWVGAFSGLAIVGITALAIMLAGFTLQHLWNWFAAPFSAVKLGLAEAIGLCCLLSGIKGRQHREKKSETPFRDLAYPFVNNGLLLLIGWLAHLAMS